MKAAHRAPVRHLERETNPQRPSAAPGIVVGVFRGWDDAGSPKVEFRDGAGARFEPARTTVELDESHVGQPVVLAFDGGDAGRPIVLGIVRDSVPGSRRKPEARLEAKQLVITAEQEIVLRSGKASITLTQDGKVILQGEYLVSRATAVNRIQGGSVQIN